MWSPARPLGWSDPGRTTLEIKTGGWRTRHPLYIEAAAPCRAGCPSAEPIPHWVERVRLGDYATAWALIREENPFPAVLGRVCAHPCESGCNRAGHDGAVAINALERFVGDWGLRHGRPGRPTAGRSERIGVVGGGPAGLACAYHLARLGYRVTLFEAAPELGGLLRYGIPEYRLPRPVLDREIGLILDLGVEVVTSRRLGAELGWDALAAYHATFLAVGAGRPKRLGVAGESARRIDDGVAFLRRVNGGDRPALGGRLVVIGGGSTAMDVARSARRLGVPSVVVLALEARDAMPASPEELAQALAEGVVIGNGVGVVAFVETGGAVSGVVTAAAGLGREADGEIRPVFGPGPRAVVPATDVILAIGQGLEASTVPSGLRIGEGLITVAADGATSASYVFAGGDATSTRRTVAHAVAAGTRAARAIDRRLSGRRAAAYTAPRPGSVERPERVVAASDIDMDLHPRVPRVLGEEWRGVPTGSFAEVAGGIDEHAGRAEAARCFTCGRCTGCDACLRACPDMAISRFAGGYRVSSEYCKGCGLCAAECPRGGLVMVESA